MSQFLAPDASVVIRAVATLLAITSFAAYGIAIRCFFARPDGVQPGMSAIKKIGAPLALVYAGMIAWRVPRTDFSELLGILMLASALVLFVWAWWTARKRVSLPLAFSSSTAHTLLETGPYALTRHPFYCAYVMTWSGGALYTWNLALLAVAAGFAYVYWRALQREEASLLCGANGPQYARYKLRTGIVGPRLPLSTAPHAVMLGTTFTFALLGLLVLGCAHLLRLTRNAALRRDPSGLWLKTRYNYVACKWGLARLRVLVMPVARQSARPELIVANHLSWIDTFVLGSMEPVVFVARGELYRGIAGLVLRSFGTIFLKESADGLQRCVNDVRSALAAGVSVVVFPEGTTGDGKSLRTFHPALFEAGLEAGVSVRPCALTYTSALTQQNVCAEVAWHRECSLVDDMVRIIQSRNLLVAEIQSSEAIAPWFRTRYELAESAAERCRSLLLRRGVIQSETVEPSGRSATQAVQAGHRRTCHDRLAYDGRVVRSSVQDC